MEPIAMVNGERRPLEAAKLAITDDGAARGDGAFETIGIWGGRPFRLSDHLERLAASLDAIALPPVDAGVVREEATALLKGIDEDGALRIYVTGSGTRVLTLSPPPLRVEIHTLDPQPAPWIRPRATFDAAGAKTMSYMPNMAATRRAQRNGADDALLVSLEGWVLEGPTFAVMWAAAGALYATPVSLGIVDSISRRTVLELARDAGIPVVEEPRALDDVLAADEVMVSSSVRPLLAITRIGDHRYEGPTPIRDQLADALERARRSG